METLRQLVLICLIFEYIIISDCGMTFGRKKRRSLSKTRPREKSSNSVVREALKFIREIDPKNSALWHDAQLASYEYSTNLTTFNRQKQENAFDAHDMFLYNATEKASKIDWMKLKGQNDLMYRWFIIFLQIPRKGTNSQKPTVMQALDKSMGEIFNEARICPTKDAEKSKCNLTLFPDVNDILEKSRDPEEMKYLWKQARDATGKKMKRKFIEHVNLGNKEARRKNFRDFGDWIRNGYESETFVSDMAEVMKKVQPLYMKFHAYVRKKLIKFYKNVYIAEDGPIPAHLLGDLYAQKWSYILDITKPSNTETINVTDILVKRNAKTVDMFKMAENFFVSLGLERMTPLFWSKSVLEKPKDRNMTCNAAAFDMYDGKDYRIRMCNKITEGSLSLIFHEMGHIEQYMQYKKLPGVFRDAANPGFHEAIGEVITLSVSTLDYLQKAGYINKSVQYDEDLEIAYLFKTALAYLPTVPYAYIIDHYRYHIYNGSMSSCDLNKMWWNYRLEYQGVCPPVKRTENDFDAGAKNHVANVMEYMRYFIANIVAFQMHKALCKAAGHTGDLFKCSIYGSKEAGKLFKKVLSLGRLKPWQEVMMVLTGDTRAIDPKPFLEYFKKLEIWLETGENKNNKVGWKSQNSMVCPGKNDEMTALYKGEKSTTSNGTEITSTKEEQTISKDGEKTTINDTKARITNDFKATSINNDKITSTNDGNGTSSNDNETTKSKDVNFNNANEITSTKTEETTISNKEETTSTNVFKLASINNDKKTWTSDGKETSTNDKGTSTNAKETTPNNDKEITPIPRKQTTNMNLDEVFYMLNDYIESD